MSRRGGGRRPDSGRDQQPTSPAHPRGRGGGYRGGRGRGGGDAFQPPPIVAQPHPRPSYAQPPATSAPRPQPPQTTAGPSNPWRPVAPPAASAPRPPPQQATAGPSTPWRPVAPPTAQPPVAAPRPPASAGPSTPWRPVAPAQPPATAARPVSVAAAGPSAATAASDVASSSSSKPDLAMEMQQKLVLAGEKAPPVSAKALVIPPRPGYGTVGQKCIVRANHFLTRVAINDFTHYDVTITPEISSKKVNREVIKQLVRIYRESHMGAKWVAFDGRKGLYTAGKLPFETKEFEIQLEDDNPGRRPPQPPQRPVAPAPAANRRRERIFRVVIRFASKPDIEHLRQFLAGRQRDVPSETIQALDVVLRHVPSLEYTVVGNSFCDPSLGNVGPLGDGVEYVRGYYQSIRPTQMGLSLNMDVSARSFYEPIMVTEFLEKLLRLTDLNRPLSDQNRLKLRRAVKGIKISVDNGEFIKSYRITGISTLPVNRTMFEMEGQTRPVSVADYFNQKYNIRLQYPNLPAIQAGTAPRIFHLPMELCRISEGQRYTKKLNDRQITALLRATCQRPRDREANIQQITEHRAFFNSDFVQHFGVTVDRRPVTVNARVLTPPTVRYHGTGREATVQPQGGAWNMINKKMFNGGRLDYWTCLNFSSLQKEYPLGFCYELIRMCNSRGMQCNPDPIIPIRTERPQLLEQALADVNNQAIELKTPLQLLIIILPDQSGSYGTIKRICETELGIVSQCAQPKQISKGSMQYLENLSLKVNVKLGGRNSVLTDAIAKRIPLLTDRPTIIFGADVSHAPPGEDSFPSIASVVASMDWPEVTKYRGVVSAQRTREEIILDLYTERVDPGKGIIHGGMIRELLLVHYKKTGYKPERIIFYRDGVSEGQFYQVLLHEVDAIRKACRSMQGDNYFPGITFIVVQKRHHTRLFPQIHGDRHTTDKSGNILPGTVVDTQICHPTQFDFYLNSHAGIQGTSRPAHYHVLFDENNFTADNLQVITNNLCYTYARCTRSVSIVPPAYYAHLAAFRARYYIEGIGEQGESSASGQGVTALPRAVQQLPKIKDNVKNVMFYC
ncbi:Protein argonaute 5 [Linum grandiflorum]